jgi:seryl-tRNA synthetase
MHNIKTINADSEAFKAHMSSRGLDISDEIGRVVHNHRKYLRALKLLEKQRSILQMRTEKFNEARNDPNKADAQKLTLRRACQRAKRSVTEQEKFIAAFDETPREVLSWPNIPHESVPDGLDETSNVVMKTWQSPHRIISESKDHVTLGTDMGLMELAQTAKISGARFTTLKGPLAKLERVLGQFMMDQLTFTGYEEHSVPLLVRDEALVGTGQLPKFKDDLFKTGQYHLIPTSEVSLTNMVRERIIQADELPIRMSALTPCFRSEAGSAGRDTRGMIRQHQFYKAEMVAVTHPDKSDEEHERMTRIAENILEALGLSYRRVLLCKGDMGFSAQKTYDLEVWLPSQQTYREISSISNCGEFQARRMEARVKIPGQKGTIFPHTLNGSGLAVGRTLVAILDNYQEADGSIRIPENLIDRMNGRRISNEGKLV